MDYSPFGFSVFDKGIFGMYLRLPNFTHYEVSVYFYILSNIQNQDTGNGKKGYCYRTKTRMANDLGISKKKLNEVIEHLVHYDLVTFRKIKNYRGGKELEEYKPKELKSVADFLVSFAEELSEYHYNELTKKR